MGFKSLLDENLVSDDPFYTVVGDNIQGSYIPATAGGGSGGGTTGSVLSVTAGGIIINLILDAAAQAAPASFKNGLQQAVSILAANITDKITVNINIDYSGTGGGAAAGPDNGYYENYSWVHSMLVNNASAGDTTFNSLPTGTSIQGYSSVAVWNAQLKLWGMLGANDTTTDDASAYFSTDINSSLLVGVALHELTHAMGRVPYGAAPDVFDFYRFTSPGVHLFQGGATAPAAYFSLDNGATKIADYGQNSDPSDFLNSGVQGPNDPFNEYYTGTTLQGLTAIDLKQLDALGFHLAANTPTTIEAFGVTSLVQAGSYYFLDPTAGGSGPSLKYGGSSVVASSQAGTWAPIGAEATAGGYEVAWKVIGADQFAVWNADSNGNFVSSAILATSGSSSAIESIETSFHQDLNGDGVIGPNTASSNVIEAFGATTLVQGASSYLLYANGASSGTSIKYGGGTIAPSSQAGAWAPIGAEQSAGGYLIAWKVIGADQYAVWNADASGNYVSNAVTAMSGASAAIQAIESSFQQDLNGDGVIGPGVLIEAYGATTLVRGASSYLLYANGGSVGTTIKYGGSTIAPSSQAGAWVPIGAEQSGSGYLIAWKVTGADQYAVWNADSNGNFVSSAVTTTSGTSTAITSLEATFHQDLNGNGVLGSVVAGTGDAFLFNTNFTPPSPNGDSIASIEWSKGASTTPADALAQLLSHPTELAVPGLSPEPPGFHFVDHIHDLII